MSNTYTAKRAFHDFLTGVRLRTVGPYEGTVENRTMIVNDQRRCSNSGGLAMMKALLEEYTESSDPLFFIFYMKNDQMRVAAVANYDNYMAGGSLSGSYNRGPGDGMWELPEGWPSWETFVLVDLYMPVDTPMVDASERCNPNRATLFRWRFDDRNDPDTRGFTTILVDEENDFRNPLFLQEILESNDSIPLGYIKTYWAYMSSRYGRRVLLNFKGEGDHWHRSGIPMIGFQFDHYTFASARFTLEDIAEYSTTMAAYTSDEHPVVMHNLRLIITRNPHVGEYLMVKCQGAWYEMRQGMTTNQAAVVDSGRRMSLMVKGSMWDEYTTPTNWKAINKTRSAVSMNTEMNISQSGILMFKEGEDETPEMILAVIANTAWLYNTPIHMYQKIRDTVPTMRSRIEIIGLKMTPLGKHIMNSGWRGIMFNTGHGTIVANCRADWDAENRTATITFPEGGGERFLAFGSKENEIYSQIQQHITSRGKKLKKELDYDKIVKNAYVRMQRKSNDLSKKALVEMKKDLKVPKGSDMSSMFDYRAGAGGFVGPQFVLDLMKQLGPIGWGCTIIDGNMVWFKDNLRYETRGSRSGWESYSNKNRLFMRFEIPFHAMVSMSKGPSGYIINTHLWETGWHPNVSRASGLCHGGVGSSVLVRADGKRDIVIDINKNNGKLRFKEAIKAVNNAAELLESSTIIGDVDTGFGGRIDYFNMKGGTIPRFRGSVFADIEDEERRNEVMDLYEHDGEPYILALPPYIAKKVYAGMELVFG